MRARRSGNASMKRSRIERPIQPHLQHADFSPCGVERIDGFVQRLRSPSPSRRSRARRRVRRDIQRDDTPAGELRESIHRLLHDRRASSVERVAPSRAPGKTRPDFAPCRETPDDPATSARARCSQSRVLIDHCAHHVFVEQFDFRDSCEVRNPSKKCRNGMRDSSVAACAIKREVHALPAPKPSKALPSRSRARPSRRCDRRRSKAPAWRASARRCERPSASVRPRSCTCSGSSAANPARP